MARPFRHRQIILADRELIMREENEPQATYPDADAREYAAEAVGRLLRWLVDGTGVEFRDGKQQYRSRRAPLVLTARAIALVLIVRPELLRRQALRPICTQTGLSLTALHRYCREAERDFGRIAPARRGVVNGRPRG